MCKFIDILYVFKYYKKKENQPIKYSREYNLERIDQISNPENVSTVEYSVIPTKKGSVIQPISFIK